MKKSAKTPEALLAEIQADFKKPLIEIIILLLLTKEEMYAYQMNQELTRMLQLNTTICNMYPILRNLQNLGCIQETRKEISDNNRVRMYYAITDFGREYLENLKNSYEEVHSLLNDILANRQ